MKALFLKSLLAIVLICQAIILMAAPAYPSLITKKQPDGTTITLFLKGDEKAHWMESEDGYSLMYNNNKTIVYAIANDKGDMIPSSVVAKNISNRSDSDIAFLNKTPKRLTYSTSQVNTLRSIWEIEPKNSPNLRSSQSLATVEKAKAICTLIEFPDKKMIYSKADFDILMNQRGYSAHGAKGSVKDYYYENSYGQLDFEVTIAGPYTASKNWAYYGQNGSDKNDMLDRVQELAKEAAQRTFTDPNISNILSNFDNDNNGSIDAFHFIYAGYGEEAGGDENSIWAHKYGFSPMYFGSKWLNTYSCSPELRYNYGGLITNIGVICHELCHVFGAPDFYDIDDDASGGKFSGTGYWDLMASGSWNEGGVSPAHINMYQKIKFGWVIPVTLDKPETIANMQNSAEHAVAYRYDTTTPGEYFVLENRQKKGFDSHIPGSGLLIYRVSITQADIYNNTVNNKHPQKVYVVCASMNTDPTGSPNSYGTEPKASESPINLPGCPFPGSTYNRSFTDYTTPSATSWKKANTLKPITEITQNGETISFLFMKPGVLPVNDLQLTPEGENVKITWKKPSDEVTGYNIYRNNALIIKLLGKDNTYYTQINVSSGKHSYCVTALYPEKKESIPACKDINLNSNVDGSFQSVKNIDVKIINNGRDVELNWESPFVNEWLSNAGSPDISKSILYNRVNEFSSVVRFTSDDLKNFYSSKLTKIRFAVRNLQCKHSIQIWLVDIGSTPIGSSPVTQVVNNPATLNDNYEVTLNNPIQLPANKELWIGIKYELNPMVGVAAIDFGPKIKDRNFYIINNQWGDLHADDNFNWYISAHMQFENNFLNAPPTENWLKSSTAVPTNYIIYRNNQVIATTTKSEYLDPQPPSGKHIYCIAVAYNNNKESEPICVEVTSENNNSIPLTADKEIEIYPNPIRKGENLVIRSNNQIGSTLSIYDISGKLLQQEQINEDVIYKKMDFEPDIYLLQIKNNANTFIRKIIIN